MQLLKSHDRTTVIPEMKLLENIHFCLTASLLVTWNK